MLPILFRWGTFEVPAWHFFYLVASLAAYGTLHWHRKLWHLEGWNEQRLNTLFLVGYIGGYFGARILSIFVDEHAVHGLGSFAVALFQLGAMTFYGGALGAAAACVLYAVWTKLPLRSIYDSAACAGLIAVGLGRVGCYLNGDDFGAPIPGATEIPWYGAMFPVLDDHIVRYSVQLWEALFGIAAGLFLTLYGRSIRARLGAGFVGIFATVAYALFRFWIEYFRGDDRGWFVPNVLSTSQGISLMLIALSAVCAVIFARTRAQNI